LTTLEYGSILGAKTCVAENGTLGMLLMTWVSLTFTPYTKSLWQHIACQEHTEMMGLPTEFAM